MPASFFSVRGLFDVISYQTPHVVLSSKRIQGLFSLPLRTRGVYHLRRETILSVSAAVVLGFKPRGLQPSITGYSPPKRWQAGANQRGVVTRVTDRQGSRTWGENPRLKRTGGMCAWGHDMIGWYVRPRPLPCTPQPDARPGASPGCR